MRPTLALSLSPDDKPPDEALLPTTEHPDAQKDGITLACHPVKSSLKINETGNNISGAQGEKEVSGSWNISRNETEDDVSSDTLAAKWKLIVSTSAKEATNGRDGIHQLLSGSVTRRESSCDAQSPKLKDLFGQEGVELIADSEKMPKADTGQMSSRGQKMHDGSVNAMCGIWLSGTSGNTCLENSNLLPTNMDKIFGCDSERRELVEKEGNNFVYRLNKAEIKGADHPPGSPTKSSLSSTREDLKESQAGNTQGIQHHAENTLMQPVTRAADNLDRNIKQRITVVAVRQEETESRTKTGIGRSTGDKMDTESHLCSIIQPTEEQCETDDTEVCESPVRVTELEDSGRGRDESVMPTADDEGTSTGRSHFFSFSCSNIQATDCISVRF